MTDDEPVRIPIEAELDLHAFAPRDIPSVVSEYIDAAVLAGLREVRLVHGRGRACSAASSRPRSSATPPSPSSGTIPPPTWAPRSPTSHAFRHVSGSDTVSDPDPGYLDGVGYGIRLPSNRTRHIACP